MANDEDPFQEAVDELYSADPDDFMTLRGSLSAAAKKAGHSAVAKRIAALRKPTRSAYTANRLARADPDAVSELLDLGNQLRAAERSVDAKQIRELTSRRRRLVDVLTRRAFEIVEEGSPSSALRDEVVSTLTAALADADVADRLVAATLVKPARWEGFGLGGSPDLTLVAPPPARSAPARQPVGTKGAEKAETVHSRRLAAAAGAEAGAERKARARAEAETAKQARLDEARRAADDAEEAVILATDEEEVRLEQLRGLEERVADARRGVDEARVQLRRAEIRQRRALDVLRRLER